MELGNAYLSALRLPALLNPQADALADELDESVSLAVADRDGIRFIHQATRRRAMSLSFRIGDLLPAERTAPGPLFATEWTEEEWRAWGTGDRTEASVSFRARASEARTRNWSLDDQLIEPGLVAVGVPVRHPRTRRIACVANVVSPTSRHAPEDLERTLLPPLRAAAAEMERTLEEAPSPPGHTPRDLATWTSASKQELGRDFVESLARGLTVLTAFGEGRADLPLTEVAKATGLARATARRALITYEHLGLVETEGNRFRLTPRVLSLGYPPLSRTTLTETAAPHLEELATRIAESTALAVLAPQVTGRPPEIRYTAWIPVPHVMSVRVPPGTRVPGRGDGGGPRPHGPPGHPGGRRPGEGPAHDGGPGPRPRGKGRGGGERDDAHGPPHGPGMHGPDPPRPDRDGGPHHSGPRHGVPLHEGPVAVTRSRPAPASA
jgi:IclR family transcriptional regulator, pca regulon regulatory protein